MLIKKIAPLTPMFRATFVNPVTVILGVADMKLYMREDEPAFQHLYSRGKSLLMTEVTNMTSSLKDSDFPGLVSSAHSSCSAEECEHDNFSSDSDDSDDEGGLSMLRKHRATSQHTVVLPPPMTRESIIKKEVDAFLGQVINAEDLLRAQLARKTLCINCGDGTPSIDWKKVRKGKTLYISSVFDSLEYWKTIGRKNFPLIALVAPRIISIPGSNGFQERIFNICTFFDSELRMSMKDSRFEMSTLLTANAALDNSKDT